MDLDAAVSSKDMFAQEIHNKWGVGYECRNDKDASGGTGVLLVLSLQDRFVYISRGSLLEKVLTDRRLDNLIENKMKPLLRESDSPGAIIIALNEIDRLLQLGEPSVWLELIPNFAMDYGWMLVLFGTGILLKWYHDKERIEYAKVASHLTELDMSRAAALQGRFQCQSCPICLEHFIPQPCKMEDDDECKKKENDTKQNQSDSKLRNDLEIGNNTTYGYTKDVSNHVFEKQQPLIDTDTKSSQVADIKNAQSTMSSPSNTTTSTRKMIGSDNLPLKLLRCGHVFDTTCWEDWVSSGHGNINKCPICQQDVGGNHRDVTLHDSNSNSSIRGENVTIRRTTSTTTTTSENDTVTMTMDHVDTMTMDHVDTINPSNSHLSSTQVSYTSHMQEVQDWRYQQQRQQDQVERTLNQYTRDRNFRLERLARRYPRYVQQQHIQRWTQVNYDGRLAQDPSFMENDPSRVSSTTQQLRTAGGSGGNSNSGFGSSSGFGGGSSGGGRGSTW